MHKITTLRVLPRSDRRPKKNPQYMYVWLLTTYKIFSAISAFFEQVKPPHILTTDAIKTCLHLLKYFTSTFLFLPTLCGNLTKNRIPTTLYLILLYYTFALYFPDFLSVSFH